MCFHSKAHELSSRANYTNYLREIPYVAGKKKQFFKAVA